MRGKGKSMENIYVSLEMGEYAKLIECKTRLDMLRQYMETTDYVSYGELCVYLGVKNLRKDKDND
jgi:hypothetical protein